MYALTEAVTTSRKPCIFITGTSSGIGRACLERLLSASFAVFAAVRRESDAEELVRVYGDRVHPVVMDLTDQDSIAAAVCQVEAQLGTEGLTGLVNCAGIGVSGPVEYIPLAELRRQFEVNVFGQITVTQALLPLLRRVKGRIVNIGSIGDRLTIPFGGPLCASKHALAALNDALRQELYPWGIHVCLIEPASISTPAVDKLVADNELFIGTMSAKAQSRYNMIFREFTRRAAAREKGGSPPSVVAEVVLEALTATRPRTRYLCGKDARLLATLSWLLPDRLFDRLRRKLFGIPHHFGGLES